MNENKIRLKKNVGITIRIVIVSLAFCKTFSYSITMGTPMLIGFKIYSSLLSGIKLTPCNVHNMLDKMSHLYIRLSIRLDLRLRIHARLRFFPFFFFLFFFSQPHVLTF